MRRHHDGAPFPHYAKDIGKDRLDGTGAPHDGSVEALGVRGAEGFDPNASDVDMMQAELGTATMRNIDG